MQLFTQLVSNNVNKRLLVHDSTYNNDKGNIDHSISLKVLSTMAQNGLGSQQKPIPEMLLSLYLFCIFEVLI